MREEEIQNKILYKYPFDGISYAVNRLGIPAMSEYRTKSYYSEDYLGEKRRELDRLGSSLSKADYLEKILSRNIVKQNTRDEINSFLALNVYPELGERIRQYANSAQYGVLEFNRKKTHELFLLGDKYSRKVNGAKAAIKDKGILNRLFYKEAESYEKKNREKLVEPKEYNWGSPKNRSIIADAGDLWARTNQGEKAEKYYLWAGPYEYSRAASAFERINDEVRAVKFWTLAAENPTGYSDEVDYRAGLYWERAGNLPDAIKSFKSAISMYYSQDGTNDLHGDPRPGKESAETLEDRVRILEKLIADGKAFQRNPIEKTTEDVFTFPM